jgi:hypothetical protein
VPYRTRRSLSALIAALTALLALCLGTSNATAASAPHAGTPLFLSSSGLANMTNFQSGRCVGIANNYAGDWTCTSNADQQWYQGPYSNAWGHELKNGNGQCLSVSAGGTTQGSLIRTWDCEARTPDQFWQLQATGYSGEVYVVNFKSNLVLAVKDGSNTNGAPLILWNPQGHFDQMWG